MTALGVENVFRCAISSDKDYQVYTFLCHQPNCPLRVFSGCFSPDTHGQDFDWKTCCSCLVLTHDTGASYDFNLCLLFIASESAQKFYGSFWCHRLSASTQRFF